MDSTVHTEHRRVIVAKVSEIMQQAGVDLEGYRLTQVQSGGLNMNAESTVEFVYVKRSPAEHR